MSMEEEEYSPFAAYSSGCDIHGENFLRECTMCGIEFCSACFPQSTLCSDCAAQGSIIDDEDEEPTEEEKELRLLDGFNDDEPAAAPEEIPATPSAKKAPAAPKGKAKAKGKHPEPKTKDKASAKPAPTAKPHKSPKPAPKKRKG